MPDIDLEPHEYRRDNERAYTFPIIVCAGLAMLGLWQTGLFFDWRGWATVFFAFGAGLAVVARFPRYFWDRR